MRYTGYIDIAYNPETGEYISPASTARNHEDYPAIAVWNGDGYYDTENEVYFEPAN